MLDKAANLAILLFALLDEMLARRPAALSADDLVSAVFIRLAHDEIMQHAARQLDAVRQLLDALDAIDFCICRVWIQFINRQPYSLVRLYL